MKIDTSKETQIIFAKEVQTVDNVIDINNTHKLLAMFTKIYSDEPLAILREITSNAHDANVANNSDKPIIVGLYPKKKPVYDSLTNFEQIECYELVIKDNGLGMTKDFMLNRFTKLMYSTKDTENVSIGGFGLK